MVRGGLKQCGLAWPPLPSHQFPPQLLFPFTQHLGWTAAAKAAGTLI